jgi:hypothetical protein
MSTIASLGLKAVVQADPILRVVPAVSGYRGLDFYEDFRI